VGSPSVGLAVGAGVLVPGFAVDVGPTGGAPVHPAIEIATATSRPTADPRAVREGRERSGCRATGRL
jgi:hypothetical protein